MFVAIFISLSIVFLYRVVPSYAASKCPDSIADIDHGGSFSSDAMRLDCLERSTAVVRGGLIDGSILRSDHSNAPYTIEYNLPDAEVKGGLLAIEQNKIAMAKRLWSEAFSDYARFVRGTSHEQEGAHLLNQQQYDKAFLWYYEFYSFDLPPNKNGSPLALGPDGSAFDGIVNGDTNLVNGPYYGYILNGLAAAYHGKYAVASSFFKKSLIENPYAADSFYFIAASRLAQGDLRGAEKTWSNLIDVAVGLGGYPPDTGLLYETSAAELWYPHLKAN